MWGNIFSQGAGQAAAGEVGSQAMMQAITPVMADVGEAAMANAPEYMMNGTGDVVIGQAANAAANPGFMDSMNNLFGSKAFANITKAGFGGFGAYNAYKGRKDAKKFQNANLKMAQGAYDRNVARDERMSNLVF